MVLDIQAKEVIDKIARDLKIQPSLEVPRKLSEIIQLVYNVNPERETQVKRDIASDSASQVIHAVSSDKDTFLVGCSISVAKDAIATSINSSITAVPLGRIIQRVIDIRYEPTTAASNLHQETFFPPILLDPGSNVAVTNSTAVGSIDTAGVIFFYEVDRQ